MCFVLSEEEELVVKEEKWECSLLMKTGLTFSPLSPDGVGVGPDLVFPFVVDALELEAAVVVGLDSNSIDTCAAPVCSDLALLPVLGKEKITLNICEWVSE